jgi:nucleoside-diphosphate-sugar epimerase
VHVEDVAAGHVLAMDAHDNGKWPPPRWTHWHYLLGGENVAVADLFGAFAELSGVPAPKPAGGLFKKLLGGGSNPARSKERETMDSRSWAYTSAMAQADFAFRTRPFREGLRQTVDG